MSFFLLMVLLSFVVDVWLLPAALLGAEEFGLFVDCFLLVVLLLLVEILLLTTKGADVEWWFELLGGARCLVL